jgi:hypothetical protein
MSDRTEDPREYRGGVREPENAKGNWADNEGVVPREMTDEGDLPPQDNADGQALKDEVMGEVTGHEHEDEAGDRSAGDQADATTRDDSMDTDTAHTDPAPTTAARTGQGKA